MEFVGASEQQVCALPQNIAIDGPAASGKSSVGQALAASCGYAFLDTGLMYRAFTLAALRAGLRPDAAEACSELAESTAMSVEAGLETRTFLDGIDVTGDLREASVEANVSRYSAIPGVRVAMVRMQREIANRGLAVLAGRDIGTVVLPDAPLKFYLQASEEARAERRSTQATEWGARQGIEEARRDIHGRDVIDVNRAASPLAAASDAVIIDTTSLTLDEVIARVMEHLQCDMG